MTDKKLKDLWNKKKIALKYSNYEKIESLNKQIIARLKQIE